MIFLAITPPVGLKSRPGSGGHRPAPSLALMKPSLQGGVGVRLPILAESSPALFS